MCVHVAKKNHIIDRARHRLLLRNSFIWVRRKWLLYVKQQGVSYTKDANRWVVLSFLAKVEPKTNTRYTGHLITRNRKAVVPGRVSYFKHWVNSIYAKLPPSLLVFLVTSTGKKLRPPPKLVRWTPRQERQPTTFPSISSYNTDGIFFAGGIREAQDRAACGEDALCATRTLDCCFARRGTKGKFWEYSVVCL